MKKIFTLIFLSIISFNAIHAEITWTLSDDGTLTISGTDMPNYIAYYRDKQTSANWGTQSEKIKKVVIENGVTNIGNYAFYNCSAITSVTIPNSVRSIGQNAFLDCFSLTSINIPNSVISIEEYAFSGCSGLTSINIPNSVKSIGSSAFYGCSGLTSINIPESMTCIEAGTFYGCSGLTSITIPYSVTNIGSRAFNNCSTISSITIPNSVTSIGENIFEGCSSLTSIIVEKGNKTYDSRNDCNAIIETESNHLIYGCINTIIPNSVTSIGNSAFYGCSDLTSINIPNSLTSIGNSAFYGCSGLTSITIPEFVTNIGEKAFFGAKLRNIVIKAKTPPSGFSDDTKSTTFSKQSYYHTTLMIPEGSWDVYAYSDNWYQFINIREMAYNEVNLTNSKAYMMKSATEGSYLFYDSVNDCVGELNETALDDTEENNTWMTVEVEGKHYVYNLGAKKYLVSGKTNTGYSLSDTPASIDIEDGKDAIVFGKSKEFYMVINDKLNAVEDLESQIATTTGIKDINADANQPTIIYNVNGQIVSDNAKGLYIKNGKKYVK